MRNALAFLHVPRKKLVNGLWEFRGFGGEDITHEVKCFVLEISRSHEELNEKRTPHSGRASYIFQYHRVDSLRNHITPPWQAPFSYTTSPFDVSDFARGYDEFKGFIQRRRRLLSRNSYFFTSRNKAPRQKRFFCFFSSSVHLLMKT